MFEEHANAVLTFLYGAVGVVRGRGLLPGDDAERAPRLSAARGRSNLRGWLLTIARRKAIDAHRARARRPSPVADPDPGAVVDAHAEPDDGLWDQVRGLPSKQRKAVVLRFAGDKSYPEIAAAMSTTQDLARQSVHEGLKKLRRELR